MFQTQSVASFRAQFPQLAASVGGYPLIYLDNAATTQKPLCVIESQAHFYTHGNANIHRGVHTLSQEATLQYEQARRRVQSFVGAQHSHEIVFTSGATQAINMIASGFAQRLQPGDEILVSSMEHHSNIVPWQMACERSGAQLRVIPMTETGELSLPEYEKCLGERTRLVAVTHVSNALGTVNPIREMVGSAKRFGIPVLVDGAQAVSHMPVDVQALGCDFYVFSGHKMFAPTGIGILYGREAWLDRLPPHMGGGDMIKTVTFEHTEYNDLPYKFEAGTPNIAGAIGLGVAVDFLQETGFEWIHHQETELLMHATQTLSETEGLRILGTAPNKTGVVSFVVDGVHPYDIGTLLDQQGIAVRTGHHCAQPVMAFFGISGTVRMSFAPYNTADEIDQTVLALKRALKLLT